MSSREFCRKNFTKILLDSLPASVIMSIAYAYTAHPAKQK
jgi:hypothetical protein